MKLVDLLRVIPNGTDIAIFKNEETCVCCTSIGDYSGSILGDFLDSKVLSIDTMMVTMFSDEPAVLLCIKVDI